MSKQQKTQADGTKKEKKPVRRKTVEVSRGGYLLKRVLAFIVDWYLSSVLCNLAISLAQGLLNSEITVVKDLSVFTLPQALIVLMFVLITTLFYYVYIPVKVWKGQTPMMHVLQLKIVGLDGHELSLKEHLLRFGVGCLILEGGFYFFTTLSIDIIATYFFANYKEFVDVILGGPLQILTVVSVAFGAFDRKHTQLFHDRISKSEVIDLYDGGQGAL